MVQLWQKERSNPHSDLTIITHLEERQLFKSVASEAKDGRWKSFRDTLNRDTTLTQLWQFYRQMEGCVATPSPPPPLPLLPPDIIDANGAVLKTSDEKAQYYSNPSSSRMIRTTCMRGKPSGKS